MGYRCRRFLVSKYMAIFGLRPCPIEKAFPGKKQWDELKAKEKKQEEGKPQTTLSPKSLGKNNWVRVLDSTSEKSLVSGMTSIFFKKMLSRRNILG